MSTHNYCTYFDDRYLVRGIALYQSMRRCLPDFTLWILCLNQECHDALQQLDLPGVRLIPLEALEAADPQLKATHKTRNRYEYFLTCTPCLMRYLLVEERVEAVHYLDADLYFFASVESLNRDFEAASVAITPHRFPAQYHEKFATAAGEYNVGLVSIRGDASGLACVEWWRERCIEWCYDRIEPGRCGDQKYLEEFPKRFTGVQVIHHIGANLAPWNIANYRISAGTGAIIKVDESELLFFHFSNLRRLGHRWYVNNQRVQGRLSASARGLIYLPYLQELSRIESQLASIGITAKRLHAQPKQMGFKGSLVKIYDRTIGLIFAGISGNLIRL